jgi:osmotically-inducible protein OsmY
MKQRHISPRGFDLVVLLTSVALVVSSCAGAFTGAGAAAGVTIAQERTIGQAVDDKSIQFQINEGLFRLDHKLFGQVDVEVIEGRVLLTGSVTTPDSRISAARMTWKINGVREVLNEIQVTDRGGLVDYFKDAKITTQLRYLMLRDKEINDINFSVETVNGVLYLMGISTSRAELDKLTNHARNINGVVKVINHVRINEG